MSPIRMLNHLLSSVLSAFQPLFLLLTRFYLAFVFFTRGLARLINPDSPLGDAFQKELISERWNESLSVFESQFSVAFLSSEMSAIIVTSIELVMPIFILLGLASRFAALGLLVLYVVGLLFYIDMANLGALSSMFPGVDIATIYQQLIVGLLLLLLVCWGPGKLSLDAVLHRNYTTRQY